MNVRFHRRSSTAGLMRRLAAAAKSAPAAAGDAWADDARRRVRVDTGNTRSTITAANGKVSAGGAARWLEYGTRSQPAYPFIRPGRSVAAKAVIGGLKGVFR